MPIVGEAETRANNDLDTAEVCGIGSGSSINGKSAIHLARMCGEGKQNLWGRTFRHGLQGVYGGPE
jgi:hypothetical protein